MLRWQLKGCKIAMSKKPQLALIAARARNGVIGYQGRMPWRLSEDLKNFKALTLGAPVLMGRKTWDSLPFKPLPGRPNLVLTRNSGWRAEGAEAFTRWRTMLARAEKLARDLKALEVFVIGGAVLYTRALKEADRLYLTEINLAPEGDAFFPANRNQCDANPHLRARLQIYMELNDLMSHD